MDRTTPNPISVALVDDHTLFREGLREILESFGGMDVVGEAGDSGSAIALVEDTEPDVVLLDVEIPGDEVTETVARIRKLSPETRIIILSMYDGPQLLTRLLAAGIRGYLHKSVHRDELIAAVRSVYEDQSRLVLAVSRSSLAHVEAPANGVLSEKELEVLQLAAQALSNSQIARRLGLAEATVKRHMRNIFLKLNAVSRIDAVNKALAGSLILPQTRGDGD
ncbi:response regulator transcription factor [Nonomuraea roseoviolacea subsp. roseoviolacea]|uniref:Response regulator transcription factor n=2 Tax=Nonomuraea TaxID=83681 RepID=A0A7Y6M4H1_9ACTN|nr:response regulator transcription factor [Nonomuraea roseoviolacea]MCP2348949.1 DNA-binding NarL/FixJ family response regulator [Nonomuraea roseoviolacea subsp. carminata]NUW34788.1 response regulator transcription factor [Nonomuraea montanisoli]